MHGSFAGVTAGPTGHEHVLARRPKKPLPDLSIAKIPFVVL